MSRAFISYRRSDTRHAAEGLHAQLSLNYGPSFVFMDTKSLDAGVRWGKRLEEELDQADVVLVLIGSSWLTASDDYGRRRIDQEDDWARREVATALSSDRTVIPILVGATADVAMPPEEALPSELADLPGLQSLRLRDESWSSDLRALMDRLESAHGFPKKPELALPDAEVEIDELAPDELADVLSSQLKSWEPVESEIPGSYPDTRHELRRVYQFSSFMKAIDFMSRAAATAEHHQHHPRWENQWTSLSVYFTTWDIGHRISQLDVDLAREFDRLFKEQKAGR